MLSEDQAYVFQSLPCPAAHLLVMFAHEDSSPVAVAAIALASVVPACLVVIETIVDLVAFAIIYRGMKTEK